MAGIEAPTATNSGIWTPSSVWCEASSATSTTYTYANDNTTCNATWEGIQAVYSKFTCTSSASGWYDMRWSACEATGSTITLPWVRYRWDGDSVFTQKPLSAKEQLKGILRRRLAGPHFVIKGRELPRQIDVREMRARDTLRRVIGERQFQQFLSRGFITARGKSGLTYQIFTGSGITRVYRDGAMVERLCVVLKGDFPATDSLIMRYLMILNNEDQFRDFAIKHSTVKPERRIVTPDQGSLTDIFQRIKRGDGQLVKAMV